MESMKLLAVNNIIIVAVIHQPRSSIFQLFDQLMLLPRPAVRQREVVITRGRLQAAYPRVDPLVGGEGTG